MNEYAYKLGKIYDRTPKHILAAIVYSYVSSGGDHPELAMTNFLEEWKNLYEAGIVHLKPPTERGL